MVDKRPDQATEPEVLRNGTVLWTIGIATPFLLVAGALLFLNGKPIDGLWMFGVATVWGVVASLHYVVVKETSVEYRYLLKSYTVDLDDITEISMRETDIVNPATLLVLHLRSGGTREIYPGMVSIGPVKFLGRTAQAIAGRMQRLGLSVDMPSELRYLG